MAHPRHGPPPLPAGHVRRRALEDVLDQGAERDLTVLSAPPGSGKTSLLAAWVGDDHGGATAWVCLEPEDRDPRRLWRAVLGELAALSVVPSSSRLHRLVVSRSTVAPEFLTELTAAIVALPSTVRLVLDDVHHLADPLSQQGLSMLLRDTGDRLRLVLAGRRDPPLPLPRLRMDERVVELRADQLAFSPAESAALFATCGPDLTPAQVAVLHERTGGWVAGLRLAALSLRDHPDPDRFLAGFSGDERPVADYLVDEVLAGLAEPQREVLRRISVARRVPAGLAARLAGRDDAAEVLDDLAHTTGLVAGSGARGDPYRLPELLRSHLVADLGRRGPTSVAVLERDAAAWWAEQGSPVEALRHAGRAGDPALLADLVGRWGPWLAGRGEREALAAASSEEGGDTRLAVAAAHVHLARGEHERARAALRRARRDRRPGPDAAAFRAATERVLGRALPVADREPVPAEPALAAHGRIGRGAAALRADDPTLARTELGAGLALAHRLGLEVLAHRGRCLLAAALWTAGDVPRARAAADRALAEAGAQGPGSPPWSAVARAVAAHAALLRADPGATRALTDAGEEVADPVVRFALLCARAGAAADLGGRTAGLLALQAARAALGATAVPGALAATAALLEHRAAVELGHATAAGAVTAWLAGREPASPALALIRGWSAAATGDLADARTAIAVLLVPTVSPSPPALDVEAWLLEARIRLARADRPGARAAARHAVDLAARRDALRPFVHADGGVRALLVDELATGAPRAAFVARALAAGATSPAGVALSGREHDVLARLPSLESFDEIAGDLDVSINTIKTHVRALYGKLGVTTRRDAVLVAHEQGLLG